VDTYAKAGVNIARSEAFVERLKKTASRPGHTTLWKGAGGYAAVVPVSDQLGIALTTDGVGTKLLIACELGKLETIGIDLVAMCANDLVCVGAKPSAFLDYYATSKLNDEHADALIKGILEGCDQADMMLVGGETAEMPGFYPVGEYDLAGFIVGAVERKKLLTGKAVKPGDVLVALPSAGLHTNGYSLARKLVFDVARLKPETYVAEVGNKIGAELLKPHLCYAPALKNILARGWVSALAHITGGGIPGNLPRVLPSGVQAQVDLGAWPVPSLFKYLAKIGKIETDELLQSFNLGVGMIMVVPQAHVQSVEADLKRRREKYFRIGRIERGDSGKARVTYTGSLRL